MKHNALCVCDRCNSIPAILRDMAERSRRKARRRTWTVPLGSTWTGPQGRGTYAMVLRDPSEPGAYRLQYFDARGFAGHATRRSLADIAELLHEEFGDRLSKAPPGILDRLSARWSPENSR